MRVTVHDSFDCANKKLLDAELTHADGCLT